MRNGMLWLCIGLFVEIAAVQSVAAQFASPEVHADRRVTFRAVAPNADSVKVKGIEGLPPQEMSPGPNGVWQVTVGPLEPDLYSYVFEIDGADQIDRLNRETKRWFWQESLVEVPGDPPRRHEQLPVPHGVTHHHLIPSAVAGGEVGVYVYTPPGYDPVDPAPHPLLVLMHGFGDDERAWVEVGRAPMIADNMLSEGLIVPMVIAMPYGHPLDVQSGRYGDDYGTLNREAMESFVTGELIPALGKAYRLADTAGGRGIVGLSMGGGQSLAIGLGNPGLFDYVGGFSSATPDTNGTGPFSTEMSGGAPEQPRLLWLACGREDFLFERNTLFSAWLEEQGVEHTFHVSDGGHTWRNWRSYLETFLPLLFR